MDFVFLDIDGVLLPLERTGFSCAQCSETDDDGCVFVKLLARAAGNVQDPCCLCCACKANLEQGVHYTIAGASRFPRACMSALESIMAETGAKLVLSSSWRMAEGARERVLAEFSEFGGDVLPQICNWEHCTNLSEQSVRQWEIVEWIQNHKHLVRRWVVLDDDPSVSANPQFREMCRGHVVKTDPAVGLTAEDALKAIDILKGSAKQQPEQQKSKLPQLRKHLLNVVPCASKEALAQFVSRMLAQADSEQLCFMASVADGILLPSKRGGRLTGDSELSSKRARSGEGGLSPRKK